MSKNIKKPIILVTPGDPDGIGYEIVWKGIKNNEHLWNDHFSLVCVGDSRPFENLGAPVVTINEETLSQVGVARKNSVVYLYPAVLDEKQNNNSSTWPGLLSGRSIEIATKLILTGRAHALVTGPIHKERLQLAGFPYVGHTDMLASLTSTSDVVMMLANSKLRVSLVTTHIPLSLISKKLTIEKIISVIKITMNSLKNDFGIKKPKIAVLGLNPHAGEGGVLGDEEKKIILPAISEIKKLFLQDIEIDGPFPSDTFFCVTQNETPYDAVVCMYHDQGLIPVKLLDFQNTVNISLGLPIIRTSVDHGTAFDIANKNKADPSSFIAATNLAKTFLYNKIKQGQLTL